MTEEMEPRQTPGPDLPGSIVPRWLAWIVLLVLLSAGALSTWQCATGATLRPPPQAPTRSGPP